MFRSYLEKAGAIDDFLRTTFTRNSRGQVTVVNQNDLTAPARDVATITYDSLEGIYPIAITNALGHVTTLVTHRGLGLVGEVVDPNGPSTAP